MWDFIGTVVVEFAAHLLSAVVSELTKHDRLFWGLIFGMVGLTGLAISALLM